jgi:O-methyltransferase domain
MTTRCPDSLLFWVMARKMGDAISLFIETGLLDRLADQPASSSLLASAFGLDGKALDVLLNLMERVGLAARCDSGYCVPSSARAAMPMLKLETEMAQWHKDRQSARTVLVTGLAPDPAQALNNKAIQLLYADAMAANAKPIGLHVQRLLRSGHREVVDLGGCDGAMAADLADRRPNLRFTVVDRPHNGELAQRRWANSAARQRLRFVGGDLKTPSQWIQQIGKPDLAIISNTVHLLGAAETRRLLSALGGVLSPSGQVIVYDLFLRASSSITLEDLMSVDWMNCGSKFAMTAEGFKAELLKAGYSSVEVRQFPAVPGAFLIANV